MVSLSAARLPVSRPTATKSICSRRCVVSVTASGRQAATGGERAAGVSECTRRTVIGLAAVAATIAPLPQSTAYAAVDPVASLQGAYAAFGESVASKDTSKVLAYMADNVTWSSNMNGGFEAKGVAGVKNFFQWIIDHQNVTGFTQSKFVAQGNTVVSLSVYTGTSKDTGKPFKAELVHFAEFDSAGKIVSFKELCDTKAMDVFGVPWY